MASITFSGSIPGSDEKKLCSGIRHRRDSAEKFISFLHESKNWKFWRKKRFFGKIFDFFSICLSSSQPMFRRRNASPNENKTIFVAWNGKNLDLSLSPLRSFSLSTSLSLTFFRVTNSLSLSLARSRPCSHLSFSLSLFTSQTSSHSHSLFHSLLF